MEYYIRYNSPNSACTEGFWRIFLVPRISQSWQLWSAAGHDWPVSPAWVATAKSPEPESRKTYKKVCFSEKWPARGPAEGTPYLYYKKNMFF